MTTDPAPQSSVLCAGSSPQPARVVLRAGEPPLAVEPVAVEPVVRKVTRKGAAGPVSDPLPKKKLDVIEYATELLLEEVSTEYALPPAPDPMALPPAQQRSRHLRALLLIFPRLQLWRADGGNPFEGTPMRSIRCTSPAICWRRLCVTTG